MSNQATLNGIESKIASDLKNHPQDLTEVFKELRDLRSKDGSEQVFQQDLSKINKDLQDHNILPNLKIVEDPSSADGFNIMQQMMKDWQSTGNSGGSSSGSGGGGGSDGGGSSGGGSSSGSGGGDSGGSGDSGGEAPPAQDSPADPNLPSDVPSGSLAAAIIQAGENVGGREGTVGMCLKGVEDSLASIGINMPRRNYASDMAGDFAADKRFQEVNPNEPPKPGDIIVHGGTPSNPAGHIAIVLPNGQESSDHIQGLISTAVTKDFGPSRVFRPTA